MRISSIIVCTIALAITMTNIVFGGGIVTNTNQSASYLRMLIRDASNDIDAVYYNPAGLTALPDGLSLGINNQIIFQKRDISNDYVYLNTSKFEGKVNVPFYPGIYACYRYSDFAFSLGFNPIGGGGSAEYEKGLPSFQLGIADLVPGLGGSQNASYSTDIYFKGSSVYYGVQGGISYKINDMISVFAGVRYNIAQNIYQGHLNNTSIITKVPNYSGRADVFFANLANQYKTAKEQFAQAGKLDSATKYGTLEAQMNIKAKLLGDQEADVEQTGNGITPIFGVDLKLLDNKLNIGLKYELNTPLTLKNNTTKDIMIGYDITKKDTITQFPDGKETNSDIPALLSVGAGYKVMKDLSVQAGFHYFFDKNADWGGLQDSVVSNTYEVGLGVEYSITNDILVSAGYLYRNTNAGNGYQSDFSYAYGANTYGFGGRYKLMPNLDLNLGFMYTKYDDGTKTTSRPHPLTGVQLPSNYTFSKTNLAIAIGFDWHISGK